MNLPLRYCATMVLAAALFAVAAPQIQDTREPAPRDPANARDTRLPNGKSQQEEMLKADHASSLKDAAQLVELAEGLKEDLEKNDRHVLSVSTLKKTEEIEKLAKRIRSRL